MVESADFSCSAGIKDFLKGIWQFVLIHESILTELVGKRYCNPGFVWIDFVLVMFLNGLLGNVFSRFLEGKSKMIST